MLQRIPIDVRDQGNFHIDRTRVLNYTGRWNGIFGTNLDEEFKVRGGRFTGNFLLADMMGELEFSRKM